LASSIIIVVVEFTLVNYKNPHCDNNLLT